MPRTKHKSDTRLRGCVENVYYSCPTFSAGRIRTKTGDRVPFAGRIFAQEEDRLILCGKWKEHQKYGLQFEAESMEYDQELDIDGLTNYIAKHPDIKGIGPSKARIIAEKFGDDFDRYLSEEPETIAQVAHVPIETIKLLHDIWEETRSVNQAMVALSGFELSHNQVIALVKKFGNAAAGLLRSDPYSITRMIPGFGFKRIDRIARDKLFVPKDSPERIRSGIIYCVEEALNQGDCWVEYEDLLNKANTLLVLDSLDSKEQIEKALDLLIEEKELSCYSADSRFLVAKPQIREMEEHLAKVLQQGKYMHPSFMTRLGLEEMIEFVERNAPRLNHGQTLAVTAALRHRITLISGGAGSGKTFTISALVGICQEHDLNVVLTAPTGKAAKRMEEVVGIEAKTIHRLLGYNGESFSDVMIDADVVIVDEASMICIPLAWHLFRAIDLTRTAVVLVGDHNQLPPVGPGNLLRDMIKSRVVPTVILESVVRQAGELKENSTAVLHGEVRDTSEKKSDGRRAWYVMDKFTDAGKAKDVLQQLFEEALSDRLGFDIIRDVQVLTPTHKGPLGTRELNIMLQQVIQRKLWDEYVTPTPPGRRPKLMLRDKVIQTRNNYTTGVMNGTIGFVVDIDDEDTITIDFDGTKVSYEKGAPELQNIQLAYALSIHKGQGSEFPCSIVIVHKSHSFMHHRNLLYTGVTRASESVIIIGDRWGINNCAKIRQVEERKTFLSLLLGQVQDGSIQGE
ncbi:MAG: SF1B family DNA helicase RecD2 [Armatimonadota bacterium]